MLHPTLHQPAIVTVVRVLNDASHAKASKIFPVLKKKLL